MNLSSKSNAELGEMLIIAGIVCILVWLFLKFLVVIGVVFIVLGFMLWLMGTGRIKS